MINLFRKNQRVLMLIVAVLTIVAFIFLYNTAQLDQLASSHNPTIYGRTLTPGAIDRQVKNYQLTAALGQYELLSKLGGTAADREAAVSEFVWNLLVLQHQAALLGVQPTDGQVADRIEKLPVFQTDGHFDPTKYSSFLREQLAPRGFTERQLEEVMRDSLRLEKISTIVEAPVAVGDAELREAARVLQPVTGTIVSFNLKAALEGIQVSDEEISSYYNQNLPQLNTTELRAVRYVAFELPSGDKLEGRQKVEALQKLADSASKFVDQINTPGTSFQKAAEAAGLTVKEAPAFDRSGQPAGGAASPDPAVAAIAPPTFLLNAPGTTSDVIQGGDAFYVVELKEVSPARPLTLVEATPQIRSRLESVAAEKAARAIATSQLKTLSESLAAGKSISDAAKAAGVQTAPLDKLVPTSDKLTPEQRTAVAATLNLKEGELSGVEMGPEGPFVVYLQTRGALDEKEFEKQREEMRSGLLENKKDVLFAEWLRVSRDDAKIRVPGAPRG